MRAFYTCRDGRTADLCELMNSAETRLTIRSASGNAITREFFPTWAAAVYIMRTGAESWTNDLTGETLPPRRETYHFTEDGSVVTGAELLTMICANLAYLDHDDPAREDQEDLLRDLLEDDETAQNLSDMVGG